MVKYMQEKFERSSCIVSEFSGGSKHLSGALVVNPYDTNDISKGIDEALNLSVVEKTQRMEQIYEYIQRVTTLQWAQNFLVDMKRAYDPVGSYVKTGFGLNWQLIKSKKGFKELNVMQIQDVITESKKRVFIFDQEGVIPMKPNAHGKHEPSHEVVEALNLLSANPANIVFVVSKASKAQMHKWYHNLAPNIGLAAENGFFLRWSSANKKENDWDKLLEMDDFQWINQVKLIMEKYQRKTDGSFIEVKESSIVWNCSNTDLEFAQMQAKELISQLSNLFEHLPIEIIESKKSVQVISKELKMEKLVKMMIEKVNVIDKDQARKEQQIDFIFYIGEESHSEKVFRYLN